MSRIVGLAFWALMGLGACAPQPVPPSDRVAASDYASALLDSEFGPALRVLQADDPARFNTLAAEMAAFHNATPDPKARQRYRGQIGRDLAREHTIYLQNAPSPLLRAAFDDLRALFSGLSSRPQLCGEILSANLSEAGMAEAPSIAPLFTGLANTSLLAAFEGRFRPVPRAVATQADFDTVFAGSDLDAVAVALATGRDGADPAACTALATVLDHVGTVEGPVGERVMASLLSGILPG